MVWQVRGTRYGVVVSRWMDRADAEADAQHTPDVVVEPASGRLRPDDPEGTPVRWVGTDGVAREGTYTGWFAPLTEPGNGGGYASVSCSEGTQWSVPISGVQIRAEGA